MARRLPCPRCSREVLVERAHEGFEVPCPACGERFTVPPESSPAAAESGSRLPPPLQGAVPAPVRAKDGAPDDGMTALLVALISCGCPFAAPVSWMMASRIRADAKRDGREPPAAATAAWILSILTLCIAVATAALAVMALGTF